MGMERNKSCEFLPVFPIFQVICVAVDFKAKSCHDDHNEWILKIPLDDSHRSL